MVLGWQDSLVVDQLTAQMICCGFDMDGPDQTETGLKSAALRDCMKMENDEFVSP